MILKDAWYTVNHILRDKGIELSLEQVNRYIQLTNHELKNKIYGPIGDPKGYETEQQVSDALINYKTESTISLTSGEGTLPDDYWRKVKMEDASTGNEVEIVESAEFLRRKENTITGPSTKYPLCEIKSSTISVSPPDDIASVKFTYLKTDAPEVALKYENSIQTYDSENSVDLLLPQDRYMDFIRTFVGLLSMPMTNQELLSYVEAKSDKEL